MKKIQENIPLSQFTSLRLGGAAQYFSSCTSKEDLIDALKFAKEKKMRVQILGGGSNTIFVDSGFNGLVVKIDLKGMDAIDIGDEILLTAHAGEIWDDVVKMCCEAGYAGIECLSGIPGSTGATPIQNVGAYGQEVKDSIEFITVIDRLTFEEKIFYNSDCNFSYRNSRFKTDEKDKYIVTSVVFRLKKDGPAKIHYPELKKFIESEVDLNSLQFGPPMLSAVRASVITLRKTKSMVIDEHDPNSRSVGSFFLNPIVDTNMLIQVLDAWRHCGDGSAMPSYEMNGETKISAAWLIEKSGFKKGYKKDGVGISENHTLALVNINGTTDALLSLAHEIQDGVEKIFGIRLELEANVIHS